MGNNEYCLLFQCDNKQIKVVKNNVLVFKGIFKIQILILEYECVALVFSRCWTHTVHKHACCGRLETLNCLWVGEREKRLCVYSSQTHNSALFFIRYSSLFNLHNCSFPNGGKFLLWVTGSISSLLFVVPTFLTASRQMIAISTLIGLTFSVFTWRLIIWLEPVWGYALIIWTAL